MSKINIGNISSILKTIGLIIAGYLMSIAVAHGIQLPFTESQLAQLIGIVLGLILSYVDMKNHNDFFNEETDTISIPTELTEEQTRKIEELIQYYTQEEEDDNNV